MDDLQRKPKLVFFQIRYSERLPEFLRIHQREHLKCLSQSFEVVTIHEDCDYGQICDQHEPDIAFFESTPLYSSRRPVITNVHCCPQVPKLGFLNADGFSEGRAGFLSDMDHWGIDTFIAIATTAPEHMPGIADRLFIWPTFADADVFHDYGQWKSIPVLFTGNKNALYPWRRRIIPQVTKCYPSLMCPHPGYSPRKTATQVMTGIPYARMLNASWFVPACGTVAQEVVRKHFEVPGSKACLVTEQSPGLEAAGFVDMKNCVFADEHNILDKLEYLFGHPDELNAIIDAGYRLVHSRHTLQHRDQVFQWYRLHKSLQPGQRIVQSNPFEPLQVVTEAPAGAHSQTVPKGGHLMLLRQGDEKLWEGKLQEAERAYLKCHNYYNLMPEPMLRLALCNLYMGNAPAALSWISKPIEFTLAEYKAVDPDPVEWAYLIISLLALGKVDEAVRRSREFPWLHHLELDRVRWVADLLRDHGDAVREPQEELRRRLSVHQLTLRTTTEWVEQLCIMLRACGQPELADRVARRSRKSLSTGGDAGAGEAAQSPHGEGSAPAGPRSFALTRRDSIGTFTRKRLYSKKRANVKRWLVPVLQRIEARFGCSLPYSLSSRKNDELFSAVHDLACDEEVKSALIVGAASRQGVLEAVAAGARENGNNPFVFNILGPRPHNHSGRALLSLPNVKAYKLDCGREGFPAEFKDTVKKIKEENRIDSFDILLIDGSELGHQFDCNGALDKEVMGARFVVLEDISGSYNHRHYSRLLTSSLYSLVEHNPELRNGYAIFEKQSSGNGNGCGSGHSKESPGAGFLPEAAPPDSSRLGEAKPSATGDD